MSPRDSLLPTTAIALLLAGSAGFAASSPDGPDRAAIEACLAEAGRPTGEPLRCLLERTRLEPGGRTAGAGCESCSVRGLAGLTVATPIASALAPPDGEADDYDFFGYSVASDGRDVYVGTLSDRETGRVWIYEPGATGWQLRERLAPPRAEPAIGFGAAVAVLGDRLLVGATGAGAYVGTAFLYRRDAGGVWQLETELSASDGGANDFFGNAVALGPDRAFVAAHSQTRGDAYSSFGAVYVFVRDASGAWVEEQKLSPSDLGSSSRFGSSIAVDGGTLLVGAALHDEAGDPSWLSGSTYLFELQAGVWAPAGKLLPADLNGGYQLGSAVALDGDRALVGAPGRDAGVGAIYVFERDASGSWSEAAMLTPSTTSPRQPFGAAVALEGEQAVGGAANFWFFDPPPSVFGFERQADGSWRETFGVLADPLPDLGSLGSTVALEGGLLVIGGPWASTLGILSGEAFAADLAMLNGAGAAARLPDPLPRERGAYWDFFGESVAQVGSLSLVAAPGDDVDRAEGGAVYILEETGAGWLVTSRLPPGGELAVVEGAALDAFAERVLTTAVAGEPGETPVQVGHVFRRDGAAWLLEATLQPSDLDPRVVNLPAGAALGERFAAFGVPRFNSSGSSRVFVFERSAESWLQTATLSPPPGIDDTSFGKDVAIAGERLLVASPPDGGLLYRRSGTGAWAFEDRLDAPDSWGGVALGEGFALVAASLSAVEVAVFEPDAAGAWRQVATLAPSDPSIVQFGRALALDGERVLIVADDSSLDGTAEIMAVLFRREDDGSWSEVVTLRLAVPDDGFGFAMDVGLDGHRALVGAGRARTERGFWSGKAHLFEINTPPRARSDLLAATETGAAVLDVLANDADDEGDGLRAVALSGTPVAGGWRSLPSGARYRLLESGELTWEAGGAWDHLVEGQTATETIVYEAHDGYGGAASAAVEVTVAGAGTNLAIEKAVAPKTVVAGGVVVYTLAVTNTGPSPELDVAVTDAFPPGLEWVASSCAGWDGVSVTWLLPLLGPGATATCTFEARAASPGRLRNVAVAASATTSATASASVELGVATPGVPLTRGALGALVLLLGAVAWKLLRRG